MNKISNPQPLLQDDGEMLVEYDLTHAVRGRRHQQPVGIDLPGVQFLTNTQGQKTAVLLDLNLHQNLWNSTTMEYPDLTNFQFLINDHSRSVFLDFTYHLPLWQALYAQIIPQLPGYDSDYPPTP
ncbi:MAG: hypothetical protein HC860_03245 [Alkalinema sp. RU_4_3]|nr:hypothetical protein [Alkalinema sp. RU_4_3]